MVRFNLYIAITQLIGVKIFTSCLPLLVILTFGEKTDILFLSLLYVFASYCWNSNFGRAARGVWSMHGQLECVAACFLCAQQEECAARSFVLEWSGSRHRGRVQIAHHALRRAVSGVFIVAARISMRRRASLSAHQERAKGSYRETHFLSLSAPVNH